MASPKRGNVPLSEQEIDYIGRVVETEIGRPTDARWRNAPPGEYERMARGVVDTIVNRVAADNPDQFGTGVTGVLNKSRQFSAIAGPPKTNPYGSVQKAPPAAPAVQKIVGNVVMDLAAGNPQLFGNVGIVNYLNPYTADTSNMLAWGDDVKAQNMPAGIGKHIHYHGVSKYSDPALGTPVPDLGALTNLGRAYAGLDMGAPQRPDTVDRFDERTRTIADRVARAATSYDPTTGSVRTPSAYESAGYLTGASLPASATSITPNRALLGAPGTPGPGKPGETPLGGLPGNGPQTAYSGVPTYNPLASIRPSPGPAPLAPAPSYNPLASMRPSAPMPAAPRYDPLSSITPPKAPTLPSYDPLSSIKAPSPYVGPINPDVTIDPFAPVRPLLPGELRPQPDMPEVPAPPVPAPRPPVAPVAAPPVRVPVQRPQPTYAPGNPVYSDTGRIVGAIGSNGKAFTPTFNENTPVFNSNGLTVGTISGRTTQAKPLSFGQQVAGLFGYGPAAQSAYSGLSVQGGGFSGGGGAGPTGGGGRTGSATGNGYGAAGGAGGSNQSLGGGYSYGPSYGGNKGREGGNLHG